MGRELGEAGLIRLLDYFFLARPVLVVVVWIFPLLGARGLQGPWGGLALLLLQCGCLAGAAFVHNQLHDQAGDRVNRKCESLERGLVSLRGARIWLGLLLAGGLAAAAGLGLRQLGAGLVFFLLAALAYNLRPVRAKDYPIRSLCLAAPAYALLVLQGAALLEGPDWPRAGLRALPVVLAGLSLSLLATVPDVPGDRLAGKRTWAVRYGVESAWRTALLLMCGAGLAGTLGGDWQVAAPALAAAGWIYWGLAGGGEPSRAVAALRGSVLLQGLALAWSWPRLCLAVLLFAWLSRFYYRYRFQLSYPGLGWERT